jgi:hypothetical protein
MICRRFYLNVLLLSLCYLAIGCKSVQPVAPDEPSILIKNQVTRTSGLSEITFPACIYTPDFQTEDGTYYLASKKMFGGFRSARARPFRGGLFLPKIGAENQKQACWDEQQSAINKRLWRYDEPIPYEVLVTP